MTFDKHTDDLSKILMGTIVSLSKEALVYHIARCVKQWMLYFAISIYIVYIKKKHWFRTEYSNFNYVDFLPNSQLLSFLYVLS